jgi:hypothetical protein
MVSKGLLNSRLKDYYDMWMLSGSVAFDGADLRDGIAATFGPRGTEVPVTRPAVLGDDFALRPEAIVQWAAFVRRLGASGIAAPSSLTDVVDAISTFILPAAAAAAAGEPFEAKWTPGEGWSR